jgi:hypothetical protein
MNTAFFDIHAALIAALSAPTALAGGRIYANRLRPIAANQASAIVVRLDQAQGTEMVLGSVDWSTAYAVECYARAATGTDPAVAVDALLADAWARMAALDFTALDAVISINPQIDWQYDDAETPVVCAVMRLTAQHRTTLSNLTE